MRSYLAPLLNLGFGLLVATTSIACGGELDESDTTEGALADDEFDSWANALVSDDEKAALGGDDDDDRDHERGHGKDKRGHGKKKKKVLKRVFQLLDYLDGANDGAITIARLPATMPPKLLEKVKLLDDNGDGVVVKAEARDGCRKHR